MVTEDGTEANRLCISTVIFRQPKGLSARNTKESVVFFSFLYIMPLITYFYSLQVDVDCHHTV